MRFQGLAKYLPEFGWEPVFLTPRLPGTPDERFRVIQTEYPENVIWWFKKKFGLNQDKRIQEHLGIPAAVRESKKSFSNRVETFLRGVILYPNKRRGWCPHGIRAGTELMRNEKIDAIISSSPPEITHITAKELKRRFNVPWVADFRDLWTQFHNYRYGPMRKWFEKKLERRTLCEADALVAVSEPWAKKLERMQPDKKTFVIPNGFDPENAEPSALTKEFTVTYTGRVYHGKQDPRPFFEALAELIDDGLIDRERVKVRFFGRYQYFLDNDIERYHLQGVATQEGMVPPEEAVQRQRESQVVLLLDWNDPDEEGVYPAKVFEYLAAKRPILAVGGGEGVIHDLITETKAGVHAVDKKTLKQTLKQYYDEYISTGESKYRGMEEEVSKHNQVSMSRKYSDVLNSVIR